MNPHYRHCVQKVQYFDGDPRDVRHELANVDDGLPSTYVPRKLKTQVLATVQKYFNNIYSSPVKWLFVKTCRNEYVCFRDAGTGLVAQSLDSLTLKKYKTFNDMIKSIRWFVNNGWTLYPETSDMKDILNNM